MLPKELLNGCRVVRALHVGAARWLLGPVGVPEAGISRQAADENPHPASGLAIHFLAKIALVTTQEVGLEEIPTLSQELREASYFPRSVPYGAKIAFSNSGNPCSRK